MEREIKFRYRFEHIKTKEQITTCLTLQDVELQGLTPNPFHDLWWSILSRDQFTGQHDNIGSEIYENDIVNYAGLNCTVKWFDLECCFRLVKHGKQSLPDVQLRRTSTQQIRVVGNIHKGEKDESKDTTDG